MSLTVRLMTEDDQSGWDGFVAEHPDGTFCHRAGWKAVIERGAGQQAPYLLAESNGSLAGVLPLSLRASALFGKAAVSTMFAVYGGALATTDAAYDALYEAGWKIARANGIDVLECRTRQARHLGRDGWHVPEPTSATFERPIGGDDDALLTAIPRKQRAVVRKALDKGLRMDWGQDVDTFYHFYALSVRDLGTPVFPKPLFTEFCRQFGGDVETAIVRAKDGTPVASLMSFYHGDRVLPYYAGGGLAARDYLAHDFLYFNLMKRARDKGKAVFDFGRSKLDSGPYRFKKNWGFEPTPLHYEYRLAPGASLPDLSPTSAKYRMMVSLWKHLPLWLANRLGPPLARHLG